MDGGNCSDVEPLDKAVYMSRAIKTNTFFVRREKEITCTDLAEVEFAEFVID